MTETTVFETGSVYTNTVCGKCNLKKGYLDRGYTNKPVHGEWSRNAEREKDAHSKDILQPLKKDGTINKHFVEAHGTRSLKKELKISEREIRDNVERYG